VEKQKALEMALTQIERQFGKGSIMKLGQDNHRFQIAAIPTGALALDIALGIGGVPRGRGVEIFGPESSGKTTLALHIIAEAQRKGGIAAFIDAEHALDPGYARNLGVDVEELLISQPDTGEQALEMMGDAHVGLQARLMSQALRKLAGTINKSNTTAIFINQLREKIGVMFGSPETTPGGKALKFYASVRLDIRKIDSIKQGAEIVGNQVRVKVVKNKMAPPFRKAEFDIMYGSGISTEGNILDLAVENGMVKKSGAWYTYGEEQLGQGRENAKQYLVDKPELAERLDSDLRAILNMPQSQAAAVEKESTDGGA